MDMSTVRYRLPEADERRADGAGGGLVQPIPRQRSVRMATRYRHHQHFCQGKCKGFKCNRMSVLLLSVFVATTVPSFYDCVIFPICFVIENACMDAL